LLAILVTLAACNDHGAASLAKIKAQVCSCKTATCAEQAMKLVPQDTIESTHRTQGIARDMLDCLAKLQADERPITDPDAEGEGSAAEGSAAGGSAAGDSAAGGSAAGGSAAGSGAVDPPAAPPLPAAPPPGHAPRTGDPASAKKP
jgi:hypothetical protein